MSIREIAVGLELITTGQNTNLAERLVQGRMALSEKPKALIGRRLQLRSSSRRTSKETSRWSSTSFGCFEK
jgi:hypothetical protein